MPHCYQPVGKIYTLGKNSKSLTTQFNMLHGFLWKIYKENHKSILEAL